MGILDLADENIRTLFITYRPDRNDYTVSEPGNFNRILSANEILVPMDFKDNYDLEIGGSIYFNGMDFCITGFYEDPICDSLFYHTKRILVSESMFAKLGSGISANELREIIFLNIGLKDSYKENLKESIKELEAGFQEADSSVFSFNQPRLTSARTMVPRIISAVLVLFSVFLLGIMVLVIQYVIFAAIEEDYTSLGIMKAVGFKGINLTALLLF